MTLAAGAARPEVRRLCEALEQRATREAAAVRIVGWPLEESSLRLVTEPVRDARVIVLSPRATHPDADLPELRLAWTIEEAVRAACPATLTLRIGPLAGKESPFWRRLASRPALGRAKGKLLQPVAEADVVEALERSVRGLAPAEGCFDVVGPEVLTLAELTDLASSAMPSPAGSGEWEPEWPLLLAQRLGDPADWSRAFGIVPSAPARWAA